jgi:Uncharacterized alpha/beta hydrolase domain (DUF2235)
MSEQSATENISVSTKDDPSYVANAQDLQTIADANRMLGKFHTAILANTGNPHERLFVSCLDGTGNNVYKDPEHATTVARIARQIEPLQKQSDGQIGRGYTVGVGTEDNAFKRTLDGALGYTHMQSVENAYKQFIDQAKKWKDSDPNVEIRIAEVGFSRGAEEAATLARLIHERGIQDPIGARYTYDKAGHITHVEYTKPPLVEPGKTPQAVALFDPVDTGEPSKYDRRLPPSVVSGIQITAKDEHRSLFKSNQIIPDGISADGRFLGVTVAGAHSDIGDSYLLNGLGLRIGNIGIDFLNSLSDKPYLQKNPEPADPNLTVVHRSEESMLLYRMMPKVDRLKPEGRDEMLVPTQQMTKVPNPHANEPVAEALNATLQRHDVEIGPLPPTAATLASTAQSDAHAMLDKVLAASRSGNDIAFREAIREAADSDAARGMRAQAKATVDDQLARSQASTQQAPIPKPAATPMLQ